MVGFGWVCSGPTQIQNFLLSQNHNYQPSYLSTIMTMTISHHACQQTYQSAIILPPPPKPLRTITIRHHTCQLSCSWLSAIMPVSNHANQPHPHPMSISHHANMPQSCSSSIKLPWFWCGSNQFLVFFFGGGGKKTWPPETLLDLQNSTFGGAILLKLYDLGHSFGDIQCKFCQK